MVYQLPGKSPSRPGKTSQYGIPGSGSREHRNGMEFDRMRSSISSFFFAGFCYYIGSTRDPTGGAVGVPLGTPTALFLVVRHPDGFGKVWEDPKGVSIKI